MKNGTITVSDRCDVEKVLFNNKRTCVENNMQRQQTMCVTTTDHDVMTTCLWYTTN